MGELLSQWLLTPLQYEFMVKALGVSVVVATACALLSCFMILKGWALMGDAVSHSVLPGVVIAYGLGIPLAIGAFVFGMVAVLMIGFIQRQSRIKEDTAMGIVFTGFFALGLILLSKTTSTVDLNHILFGNLLGIPDGEMWQSLIASAVSILLILWLYRDLMVFCFDPIHARSIGLNTDLIYYLFLALLSATIVSALQTVGIVLVISLLITPGAVAYLWCDRLPRMFIVAVLGAMGASGAGIYLSFYGDMPTGASIVLLQTLVFAISFLIAPKHGLFAQSRSRQLP
jgi:manganese transport system permease protein